MTRAPLPPNGREIMGRLLHHAIPIPKDDETERRLIEALERRGK